MKSDAPLPSGSTPIAPGLPGDRGARLRAHLNAVHERAAGFTEACATNCRNASGVNSYEWLSQAINPPQGGHVLDLACGSGVLLEECRDRYGADIALSGVDMSPDELVLARSRLIDADVTLHEGLAQSLGFAGDAAFDAVLCHWALTLMDPLEPALAEIARVLKSGGVFAAIVDGPSEAARGYGEICALIDSHVSAARPDYAELGDPRARDGAALADLVRSIFPGASVTVETDVFAMEDPPKRLAAETAGFFYSSFVLNEVQRCAMLEDLASFFATTGAGRYEMPVNRLRVVCG
ncbi:class I SAM-dependent methyltransferase [Maricaulaceae bacterium MS644]